MTHTDAPDDVARNAAAAWPATLFLARHGEVEERWRGTVYGRLDVPLSPRGLRQSELLADALAGIPLAFAVSSGLARAEAGARQVRRARPAPGAELRAEVDPRFLELDRGDWAGRRIQDLRREDPAAIERWAARAGAIRAPGGESPADVQTRTLPAFEDWAARAAASPERAGLVVAHLWVVRSAVAHAIGLPMDRSGALGLPPGGLVELRWNGPDGAPPDLVRFGA